MDGAPQDNLAILTRVRQNLAAVQSRVATACARTGRNPAEVQLVAVTKYAQPAWIEAVLACGVRHLAENRPQQLEQRSAIYPPDVVWHLIGHLQRNKVRKVVPIARWIHSVDSVRLMQTLDQVAGELGVRPQVLLEVNISGEQQKDGFDPAELRASWNEISGCRSLDLVGLMTMAPFSDDAEQARPVFQGLRALRDELATRTLTLGAEKNNGFALPHLSMGMTGDFEIAIEEGATLIRIGSALWDGLEGAA